jgi:hypothetical protein
MLVTIYDCNRFIIQATGVNFIKLFSLMLMLPVNKLEHLFLASLLVYYIGLKKLSKHSSLFAGTAMTTKNRL